MAVARETQMHPSMLGSSHDASGAIGTFGTHHLKSFRPRVLDARSDGSEALLAEVHLCLARYRGQGAGTHLLLAGPSGSSSRPCAAL
jgi:hypothetical protein